MDDCELIRNIHGNDPINNARKILEDNHALLIIGPPGTGKTTLARCLAHELSAELIEVTVHGWFSRMDLIGGYVLQGGSTTWRDGIVLRAVKSGRKTLILLDEINRGEPEKFLAELFTALSSPDRKLSVPNMDAPGSEGNDIMMAFSGNPFSIIWSFRKWRSEGGEYVWGLKNENENKNILNKLREYQDKGRRVFAGIFFYGRTNINDKLIRALAIFGELVEIGQENREIAREYMLSEDYYLIVKVRPLAYLKILNDDNNIIVVNARGTPRRFNDYNHEELRKIVEDRGYEVDLEVRDTGNLSEIPILMYTFDKPIPLNYALGRWNETMSVSTFLRELRHTGLYEITEDGEKYLSETQLSVNYSLDNIYIVATANTADIGVLGSLGFALQRRFKAVRLEASRDYVVKALDVFGYGEFKKETESLWNALEDCLRGKIEDYTNYMPGWAYFVDYAKLRKSGFSKDEAFRAVFNIYVERFGCNAGGSTK